IWNIVQFRCWCSLFTLFLALRGFFFCLVIVAATCGKAKCRCHSGNTEEKFLGHECPFLYNNSAVPARLTVKTEKAIQQMSSPHSVFDIPLSVPGRRRLGIPQRTNHRAFEWVTGR